MAIVINKRAVKIALFILAIAGIAYVIAIKPRKAKEAYPPYFSALNAALKHYQPGASAGIIDLNRVDINIDAVTKTLNSDFKLRIVTKSLPSLDLLRYIMQHSNTNRLMVFSEPYIAEILHAFTPDSVDLLLGKPLPAEAFNRLTKVNGWKNINWLVDTKARLNEYLAIAKRDSALVKISLEIDVGLHRGGFESPELMNEAVAIIKQNPQYLQLTGLMGYDGHVPFVPFYINKDKTIRHAFMDVQHSYTTFVEALKKQYPPDFIKGLTFNSGGTHTYFYYPYYKSMTPVNEIAMGSGFVSPAQFPELIKKGHVPALFLSSPVLKKIETAQLPHAEKLSPMVNWWDPNLQVSYFMLGGGWPGEPVAPTGIQKNYFWDENNLGYSNLLPNQSILSSSDESTLQVGDFVFYQAWEGDGMLSFKKVLLYRAGVIVGEWDTYKGGN